MKKRITTITLLVLSLFTTLYSQEIPIENLETQLSDNTQQYSKSILVNEIKDIDVEHIALTSKNPILDYNKDGYKTIYLFVKGNGSVIVQDSIYDIVPETIFLPNIKDITIKTAEKDTLHYVKITSKLTAQDLLDLKEFPAESTQNVYYAKFTDCVPYTEPIKSPNTVSRTILPNKIIPRIAMGTVQTKGPDEVGAHKHPMLEQLFLGLSENNCVVFADDAKVNFPQHSMLHIPLGSSHSVTVDKDEVLYYVWMDFFLDKKGEEWLKTHNVSDDN
ncbi:cupin domain-containing protein [Cellulophaga sp. HaHaR_3_176]|uniref:cupin domain-containing protein n=1 Tax=Cellulophaga sp. HaHaR_3_176 TaxID=1942464 RepID=UPI001C1FA47D|nr:cupin domain-containing protein [Cellulophaga sp. HaHaR_3_176]QWX84595.1 cupin domain-containing protein [Cellulophaga sp. HaHaR_3_176]